MKKWIATILSISLVVGMAAVFNACGKKPKPEADTTAAEETTLADLEANDDAEEISDVWEEIVRGYENMSVTEKTTDEHYQEEYDALTLPVAVTQQKVEGTTVLQTTTNPAVRETTTQFMFTSPSHASTTAKDSANKTTAAANGASTAAPATTAARSTVAAQQNSPQVYNNNNSNSSGGGQQSNNTQNNSGAESTLYDYGANIGDDGIVSNTNPTSEDQVTYLDKYVRDILKTGTYTLRMDVQAEDGVTVPVTIYSDANNSEIKMSVASVAMQGAGYENVASFMKNVGTLRYIVTNKNSQAPKRYIATDAAYVELEKGGELSEAFGGEMVFGEENVSLDMLVTLLQQNMKYVSSMTTSGIMVEVYETEGVKSENGVETGPQQLKFYFTKADGYEGLVRIRIIDKDTNESQVLVVRLYNGVQKDGLTTPFKPSGVKKTEKELLEMFEKLG
jgi:hypothetical protein